MLSRPSASLWLISCSMLGLYSDSGGLTACRVPRRSNLDRYRHLTPPPEGNMASFMTEDLSDELASSAVKLSAVDLRPGRGHTRKPRWESPVREGGGEGDKQPTHSPLLGFNSRLIFVMQPPPSSCRAEQFYKPP